MKKLALNKQGEMTIYNPKFENDYIIIMEDKESPDEFTKRCKSIKNSNIKFDTGVSIEGLSILDKQKNPLYMSIINSPFLENGAVKCVEDGLYLIQKNLHIFNNTKLFNNFIKFEHGEYYLYIDKEDFPNFYSLAEENSNI